MNTYKSIIFSLIIFLSVIIFAITPCYAEDNFKILEILPSPDGKQIVFFAIPPKKGNLWIINIDGTNLQRLTNNIDGFIGLSFSPDSKNIVFGSMIFRKDINMREELKKGRGLVDAEMVLLDIDKKKQEILMTGHRPFSPKWSPSGDKIGFGLASCSGKNLWLIDIEEKTRKRLTISGDLSSYRSWGWSPDDKKIYFSRLAHGIWQMKNDGSEKKKLTDNPIAYDLYISPNGTKILFTESTDSLCLLDINRLKSKKVAMGSLLDLGDYPWASDSMKICYSAKKGKHWNIFINEIEGKDVRKITNGENDDIRPCWLPEDNKIIFVRNFNSIWAINSDGTNPHQIFPKPEKQNKEKSQILIFDNGN